MGLECRLLDKLRAPKRHTAAGGRLLLDFEGRRPQAAMCRVHRNHPLPGALDPGPPLVLSYNFA
jgi:hypothetical protein